VARPRRGEEEPSPEAAPREIRMEALVGHDRQVRFFAKALGKGVLPQVLLFTGPQGIGKATAARMAAAALLCEAPGPFACGHCGPCRKVARAIHPDLREVGLETSEESGKSRTQIVLPQVRSRVLEPLALPPYEGRRLVFILDPADALNENAQNALLKALEEPPAYAHFFLVTANPGSLLPTVRSRCHEVAFAPLEPGEMRAFCERNGIEADEAALAVAGGAPGRLEEARSPKGKARREALLRLLADGLSLPLCAELFPLLETLAKENPREVVALAGSLVRDARRVAEDLPPLRHADLGPRLSQAAARRGREGLETLAGRLLEAPAHLSRNVNPRLLLERLFLVP